MNENFGQRIVKHPRCGRDKREVAICDYCYKYDAGYCRDEMMQADIDEIFDNQTFIQWKANYE